ncbi:hypothetical protein F5B19DRAFT_463090 [Rostrohypoxylon terebratum]|nr:hypothetical protein F5B19DRAFT_463090 [Rostrohypoxylon terebratum]
MFRARLSAPISACFLLLLFILAANAWPVFRSVTNDNANSTISIYPLRVFAKRDDTSDSLRAQFINPQGVIAVLLLIGGDVVQKAIAQGTGGEHDLFTPVVFSFGWVSYAFNSVAGAIGEGTFLPPPDCPATVINVSSGDKRQNQSWVLGRLLRDLELKVEEETTETERDSGLLVTVYKAEPPKSRHHGTFRPKRRWIWYWFAFGVLVQLAVAAIPIYAPWRDNSPPRRDWSILLITLAGNVLASCSSFIPSIRTEKYQGNSDSRHTYAITRGNGHKHVFIILPNTLTKEGSCLPFFDHMATARKRAHFIDRLFSIVPAVLWIVLLLIVGGLVEHTWFLFGVGVLGMVHNILLSGWRLEPETHGIPLKRLRPVEGSKENAASDYSALGRQKIIGNSPKVMDVLKDVERKFPGVGHALLPIFFPGGNYGDWKADAISKNTIATRLQMQQLDWYSREQLPESHPARSHQTLPIHVNEGVMTAKRVVEVAEWVKSLKDGDEAIMSARDAAMTIINSVPPPNVPQGGIGQNENHAHAALHPTGVAAIVAGVVTIALLHYHDLGGNHTNTPSDYDTAVRAVSHAQLREAAEKVKSVKDSVDRMEQLKFIILFLFRQQAPELPVEDVD